MKNTPEKGEISTVDCPMLKQGEGERGANKWEREGGVKEIIA